MKVKIDRLAQRQGTSAFFGWYYFTVGSDGSWNFKRGPFATYPDTVRRALAEGHEVDNGGWRHRLLMWQWQGHCFDGYPEWETQLYMENGEQRAPAFVKLAHTRGDGRVESHALAAAWDDVTTVGFYQRDWTSDALPFVNQGETYWSGWWFQTKAAREQFVQWCAERNLRPV